MRMREYAEPEPRELPEPEQVELAVEVFRMLAEPTRVRLLWLLLDAEHSVNRLSGALGKPQSAVSQHLAKLRLARLVVTRHQGSQVFYRLANEHVRQLVADAIHNAEHAGPGVPAHHRADVAELSTRPASRTGGGR